MSYEAAPARASWTDYADAFDSSVGAGAEVFDTDPRPMLGLVIWEGCCVQGWDRPGIVDVESGPAGLTAIIGWFGVIEGFEAFREVAFAHGEIRQITKMLDDVTCFPRRHQRCPGCDVGYTRRGRRVGWRGFWTYNDTLNVLNIFDGHMISIPNRITGVSSTLLHF